MIAADAAVQVADEAALGAELRSLAADPGRAAALGRAARGYADLQGAELERALPLILGLAPA